jgi:TetR/AcrR family transcriptional regulator
MATSLAIKNAVLDEGTAETRRGAVRDFKRAGILAAATDVFARAGLEGATIRAIAQAAGYTAGAVYAYFPTKEAIYADILAQSLASLRETMEAAYRDAPDDEARVRATIRAFYDFYRERPQELELGFYLFQGMRPRGLSRAMDRALNSKLIAVLMRIRAAILRLGALRPLAAHRETVAAMCHISGVLLMARTGRLKTLDSDADMLIEHYIAGLVARLKTTI